MYICYNIRSFWTDHFYWIYNTDPKPHPLEINLLWKKGRHKDSKSLNQKSFRYKEKVCFSDPWMVGTFVRTPREIVIFVRPPTPSPSNRSILKTTPPPKKKWWAHLYWPLSDGNILWEPCVKCAYLWTLCWTRKDLCTPRNHSEEFPAGAPFSCQVVMHSLPDSPEKAQKCQWLSITGKHLDIPVQVHLVGTSHQRKYCSTRHRWI